MVCGGAEVSRMNQELETPTGGNPDSTQFPFLPTESDFVGPKLFIRKSGNVFEFPVVKSPSR
tara:strand:+ start:143 stop:328 length:186 start_codon:yes stop_codon:yes gene_type:complete